MITTMDKPTLSWELLDEQIIDSCSWDTKAKAWAFQPKGQAEPVHYESERAMLSDAAHWFGFNSIEDACDPL